MPATRTCFLHVGTGKAGSSALQYVLASTRDELKRQGYHFPNLGNKFSRMEAAQPTGGNGSPLWRSLRNYDVDRAVELIRPLGDTPDHLIFSNEGLYKTPVAVMEQFCAALRAMGYEPKALVFFRPQVEQSTSSFFQHVKSKGPLGPTDLATFATDHYKNWYNSARQLEKAFGPDNLTVKWYPAALRSGGIIKTAFAWLGLEAPTLQVPNVNPTPGLEAFKVIQSLSAAGVGRRRFYDQFLSVARDRNLLGARMALDTKTAMVVHEATKASNEMLLKQYCPDLSPEQELSPPPPFTAPPVNESVLQQLVAIAFAMLVDDGVDKSVAARALGSAEPQKAHAL